MWRNIQAPQMLDSIQRRLSLTTSLVLLVFLTMTGLLLDNIFKQSVIDAAQQQLQLVIYSLMGSASEDERQLRFSDSLAEPRLTQPDSGLYALVSNSQGQILWRSRSAVLSGISQKNLTAFTPGVFIFEQWQQDKPRYSLSHSVTWEGLQDEGVTFTAVTDQGPYLETIATFRQSLSFGFGSVAVIFVLVQFLALRWGLTPLLRMQKEVLDLQRGRRQQLSDGYPNELQELALQLQHFVTQEQNQRRRYRQALDNLAHSLKTPLSVISNAMADKQPSKTLLQDQVVRMQDVVNGQLHRATLATPGALGERVAADALIRRVLNALKTAYPEVAIETCFATAAPLRGDASDLMEIFGNVLENACKFCHGRVSVHIEQARNHDAEQSQVCITVADDGPGIPHTQRRQVLQRGQRADSQTPGQGIGLSVAAELVDLYQGNLLIEDSALGGASISITLPGFDAEVVDAEH